MNETIAIRPSRKAGLRSREQLIVTFGDVVGLRILSDNDLSEKDIFAVMTATADEDDGRFLAPVNQALLIDLARRTAEALGVKASMCRDNYGRDFVKICRIDNAGCLPGGRGLQSPAPRTHAGERANRQR